MKGFVPLFFINSVVSLIDSFKVVLVLYPRSFLALLAEQVASFTSCGLSLKKIGWPLKPVSFETSFANSNTEIDSSSGPILIISLLIFLSKASFSKQ